MSSKIVFLLFVQAVLFQVSFGQVIPYGSSSGSSYLENSLTVNSASGVGLNGVGLNGIGLNGLGANALDINSGLGLANAAVSGVNSLATGPGFVNLAAISGGGVLPVTSYSPIAPGGLKVVSDNAIEGSLLVNGQLPFLSAVAFEGALNTDGAGAASCGCGSGSIGIVEESYGSSLGGLGGLGGIGLGAGLGGVRGLGGLRY